MDIWMIITLAIMSGVIIALVLNIIFIYKKGLYEYAIKHVLAGTVFAFLLYCSVLLSIILSKMELYDIYSNVIINIVSNYVFIGILGLSYFVERIIKSRNEDKEKLTENYRDLADRYNKEDLISIDGMRYPVSSLGKGDICVFSNGNIDVEGKIEIYDSKEEYKLPGLVENNFFEIFKVHDTSVIYNNLNIRAVDLNITDGILKISSERTYYYYSMVTNRASDYQWNKDGVTIRSIYEPGPRLHPLNKSYLSNHLGFNGFILSKDGYIAFVERSKNVSVGKRTYGCSVAASLKTKYSLDSNGNFTAAKLIEGIIHEIEDELKIQRSNINNVNIINAYRDCLESGKPQILFYAESDLNAVDINHLFISQDNYNNRQHRFGSSDVREREASLVIKDGDRLVWLDKAMLNDLNFREKGIEYNGHQCENKGFLELKKDGLLKASNRQFLPMISSAAASVVMLKNYYSGV